MYFEPIEPNVMIHWLWGLRTGYKLFEVDCPSKYRNKALRLRDLEIMAKWEDEQLMARGFTPEQIVQELLNIEIEMWQAYRDQLTASS